MDESECEEESRNHLISIEVVFSLEVGRGHLPIVRRTCNPIAVQISSLAATRGVKSIRTQGREHNPLYAMRF